VFILVAFYTLSCVRCRYISIIDDVLSQLDLLFSTKNESIVFCDESCFKLPMPPRVFFKPFRCSILFTAFITSDRFKSFGRGNSGVMKPLLITGTDIDDMSGGDAIPEANELAGMGNFSTGVAISESDVSLAGARFGGPDDWVAAGWTPTYLDLSSRSRYPVFDQPPICSRPSTLSTPITLDATDTLL